MLAGLLTIVLAATVTLQSTEPQEIRSGGAETQVVGGDDADTSTESPPLDGLWPSPRLLDLMLKRWAEEIGERYDLDEEQREWVREAVVRRWGGFLADNRSIIQPLANELLEMRMDLKPPSKKQVQEWAARAAPLFEQVEDQVQRGRQELRDVLPPRQRATFELDSLTLETSMRLVARTLEQWRQGDFDQNDLWEPLPSDRRGRGEARSQAAATDRTAGVPSAAEPAAVDQIAAELDAWDKYVEHFISTYNLSEGQRDAVLSCLSELKARAIAHRDRYHEDIARLERRIQQCAGSEAELADLKAGLIELYGPVDDMFEELTTRIEQVPTVGQRARAAESSEQQGEAQAEDRGATAKDSKQKVEGGDDPNVKHDRGDVEREKNEDDEPAGNGDNAKPDPTISNTPAGG